MWLHKQSPPSRAKIFTGCVRSLNNLTLSNLTLGNLGAGTGVFENNELIGFVQGVKFNARLCCFGVNLICCNRAVNSTVTGWLDRASKKPIGESLIFC